MSNTPILTPIELRERLIESYRQSYRLWGIDLPRRELEAQVIADCQLVDAARARGELRGAGTRAPDATDNDEQPHIRPEVLADAQRDTRMKLTLSDEERFTHATPLRSRALHKNPQTVSERWGAAVARIGRITEGVGRGSSLARAVDGAELPTLAREYAETWSYFMTRAKPAPTRGVDHNPFRGLSDRDAARLFMRRVEDICDRSTGALGSWFCK